MRHRTRPQRTRRGSVVDEFRQQLRDANTWVSAFDVAWLTSCYERVRLEDPTLAGFKGQCTIVSSRTLSDSITSVFGWPRSASAADMQNAPFAVMNANPAQAALVEREAFKKTRHLPLRRLLSEAADRPNLAASLLDGKPSRGLPTHSGRPSLLRCGHIRRGEPGPS